MKTKEELKKLACDAVDRHKDEIFAFAADVAREPELGFKEVKTSAKFQKWLDDLGYTYRKNVALTGVVSDIKGKESKARVAIMGELDAIGVKTHPDADPLTGAVHACGHNAQLAAVAGCAIALKDSGIMEELDGDVVLMGVPAEECIELEYRDKLIQEGKLKFISGKQEFIRLGEFDNIDVTVMQHTTIFSDEYRAGVMSKCTGFTAKLIHYIGKEAHAGAAPFEGVNALNAAMLGLMSIHANRETFKDEDHIRIHPIITKGGDIVNVVPADVRLETYVRGSNVKAILDASEKTNRSLQAGALAVGAKCEIKEVPGYMPVTFSDPLCDLMYENLKTLVGEEHAQYECAGFGGGSTDQGDVSSIVPSIQSFFTGASGKLHGEDYVLADPDNAILNAAKAELMMIIDLLYDGAKEALKIKADFKAPMTKEQYLKEWGHIS